MSMLFQIIGFVWIAGCALFLPINGILVERFGLVALLFATPGILLVWGIRRTKARTESSQKIIKDLCGGSLPRFHHFEGMTGVTLNESKSEIILTNRKGMVKIISIQFYSCVGNKGRNTRQGCIECFSWQHFCRHS